MSNTTKTSCVFITSSAIRKARCLLQPTKMVTLVALLCCETVAVCAAPDEQMTVSLPGVVQPLRSVDVSLVQEGIIAAVEVKEGMTVHKGQILAKLDDSVAMSLVQLREVAADQDAEQVIADVELLQARRNLERTQRIGNQHAASKVDVERAQAAVKLATARAARAMQTAAQRRIELNLERKRLEQYHLKAPFDGQILRVHIQPGQTAQPGEPMIKVADLSRLRVVLHIAWGWRDHIKVGQRVRLNAIAPVASSVVAEVVSTEPVLDTATGTYRCVFEIDNSKLELPAGFAVEFPLGELNVAPERPSSANVTRGSQRDEVE